MKSNYINPLLIDPYFFGGLIGDGNTVGGKTIDGALNGALGGAGLGPLGMIGGGLFGAISSFIGGKKEKKMQAEKDALMQKQEFSNYITGSNINQSNGSNLPMAMGGEAGMSDNIMNPMLSEFNAGGTHEQNPHGGIPIGMNKNGKMRTAEEGETQFKFDDGNYIFSNRISPLNYEF